MQTPKSYWDTYKLKNGASNYLVHHLAVLNDEEIPVCVNELERNLGLF